MGTVPEIHPGRYGRVFVLNLDVSLVEHAHSDSHLIFALDNDVNNMLSVSGVDYKLSKSQAIAVNPYELHLHRKTDQTVSKCLVFYLNSDWMQSRELFTKDFPAFCATAFNVSNTLRGLLNEFATFLLTDSKAIDIEAYVFQTVSASVKAMQENEQIQTSGFDQESEVDFRVRKSMEYMQEHLGTRLKIDDVAKASGLSRPHLFNLFQKHLKLTPGVLWNTLRIETAIEQLLDDEFALNDLASALGFSEPGNFSRFFQNHTGFRPSKYRNATGSSKDQLPDSP